MDNPKPINLTQGKQNIPASTESTKTHLLDRYTVQQKNGEEQNSPYYKSPAPVIELPKGGGALKGIDEKFSVNAVNGTAALEVGLPVTPGRGGFTPGLALQYNSGSGNSEFGLGWSLSLPAIQRKTDKKLPEYNDPGESDVFVIAGAEDLIPVIDGEEQISGYTIKKYIPRTEGLFARIERITRTGTADCWWRVTTKDNIVTYYGLTLAARIADPGNEARIFKWLPQLSVDNRGNVIEYSYATDDNDTMLNVPAGIHESNRKNNNLLFTNTYLKHVQYCNTVAFAPGPEDCYEPVMPSGLGYTMQLVFDYGDHSVTSPTPFADAEWHCRKDPFSDFHAGFEIRTYRRCYRVLMFHGFQELLSGTGLDAVLVRSLDITYANGNENADGTGFAEADMPIAFTSKGYKYVSGNYISDSLPSITCNYQPLAWNDTITDVSKKDAENIPQGLTGSYQWIDLYGEGLPGVLTEQSGGWYYKPNSGDGTFEPLVQVSPKPSFSGLGSSLQWQDLDADGRRQLVSNNAAMPGYFELDDDQQWQTFTPFDEWPHVDWNSPYTRLLDLNGDGKPDILLTEENTWRWYENKGTEGYVTGGENHMSWDEELAPRILLNDKIQSIFLADMNGDGMTDIVRIQNGEVCYWPNMGYGRFGAKITMSNAPLFDRPDQFNPLYITLSDISGTGAPDILYLGQDKCTAWINLAGNAFSEGTVIAPLPGIEQYSKIAVLDFLGSGTSCIVWSSPLPQHAHAPLRYIDLMGGDKPYLMTSYANGMGKTTTLTYKHSTAYYLEDKFAGTPWATRLPFPVHCVQNVTTADTVSETTYAQAYTYHHGYYDHDEREFRGFGRVDVLDTDTAVIDGSGELDQPPVLTRTWYHTGAWMREKNLLDAFATEYYKPEDWWDTPAHMTLPGALNPLEEREAYRSLKGSMLRQEVYAQDGTNKQAIPYTVTSYAYKTLLVQPMADNRHASFYTYQQQNVAWNCERAEEDPRILQKLTLDVDEYGNVLQDATVAYPRMGDTVSFGDISNALSLIDINDAGSLKDTMDSLLELDETAEEYYRWLEQNQFITREVYMNNGVVEFPGGLTQYQLTTGNFSVEAWVQPSCSGIETLFQYQTNCGGWPGGIHVFAYTNKIYFFVSDGPSRYKQIVTSSTVLTAGEWVHIVAKRESAADTSQWYIYINGQQVSTTTTGGSMTIGNINNCSNQFIHIGGRTLYAPDYLNGSQRVVRWYNRALDSSEAELLYNNGQGHPAVSGVIFDMGINIADGVLYDRSPYNAGNGTVVTGTVTHRYSFMGNNIGVALKGAQLGATPLQAQMLITSTETVYTNDAVNSQYYRLRLPYDVKTYQLHGATQPVGAFWQAAALKDVLDSAGVTDYADAPTGAEEKRLVARRRTTFYNSSITAELSAGSLEALSLPYTTRTLAFTQKLVNDIYDSRVDDTSFENGGYEVETITGPPADKLYWMPGGTVQYGATPAATFYTPASYTDPFGNQTTVTYWNNGPDNYYLLPASVTDALGNTTTVQAYDWRCLQPAAIQDPNQNITEILYDALCMPVALAMKGKTGMGFEADELGSLDPGNSTDINTQAAFWNDPLTHAAALLGHATWRCIYDLDSANGTDPVRVAMIAREQHWQDNNNSPLQIRISYTDGLGRTAMHKAQAAPDGATPRWIGSGKTVYNNKGKAVMQYEPYYSTTHDYDTAEQAAAAGVTPRIQYDPLGRVQRTDLPDGTYTKTEWDAWTQTVYDNNDTVLDSDWYDTYSNANATTYPGIYTYMNGTAAKAAEHNATPTVMHLDVLAQPCATVQHNRYPVSGVWTDFYYLSTAVPDIQGNRTALHDARGNTMSWRYDMLKGAIRQQSPDSGTQHMLTAADGQPLYAWDAADRQFYFEYDGLRRPLKKTLITGSTTKVLEKTIYGETATTPATYNLLGRPWQQYDGAGLSTINAYDFKGNPLDTDRQLLADHTIADVHWEAGTLPSLGTAFNTTIAYDALNRITGMTDAGGNLTENTYDEAGLLLTVTMTPSGGSPIGYVTDIQYNARGQRESISYGNATTTAYTYYPDTFRLQSLRTTKATDVYQDLYYLYDPVGNITRIKDEAQRALYFNNSITQPFLSYVYDALYRLIEAAGREQVGTATFGTADNYNDAAWMGIAHKGDDNSTQNYTQYYSYDEVGNILQLQHAAAAGSYTRNYTYYSHNSRLVKTTVGTQNYSYAHDGYGNITAMPHLSAIGYNSLQQMCSANLGGGGNAYYQYDAGGQRVHKVIVNGSLKEERIYLGSYEVYRKYTGATLDLERITVHIADDTGRIAMYEKRTSGTDGSAATLQRYIYSNHLSTASLELDDMAAIISYEEYHPYGTTAYQAMNSSINAVAKRYRYTGKERDEETGLYYHGARYYIPWLCRWMACDPLEAKYAGMSAYNYGFNNPIKWQDSTGMGPDERKEIKGVKLYEVEQYKSNLPQDTAEATGQSIKVNEFTVVPSYRNEDGKNVLDHYTAYFEHRSITEDGLKIEAVPAFVIGKYDLSEFKNNRAIYSTMAAALYNGGESTHIKESLFKGLIGDYEGAYNATKNEIGDALKSPYVLLGLLHTTIASVNSSQKGNIPQSQERVAARLSGLKDRKLNDMQVSFFGSRVIGTNRPSSDLDVLIITDEISLFAENKRVGKILNKVKTDFEAETGIKLDVNIMTRDMYRRAHGGAFKQSVEENSIKLNFSKKVKSR